MLDGSVCHDINDWDCLDAGVLVLCEVQESGSLKGLGDDEQLIMFLFAPLGLCHANW